MKKRQKCPWWVWVALGIALLLLGITIGLAVYNSWVVKDWPLHSGFGALIAGVSGYALMVKGIKIQEDGG